MEPATRASDRASSRPISAPARSIRGTLACALAWLPLLALPAWAATEDGCLEHRLERAERDASREAGPSEGGGGVFDAANGRDHHNYPPNPQVAWKAMRLAMRFDDLASGSFTATERLTVAPVGVPVGTLLLDAEDLKVKSVKVDGTAAEWSNDGHLLGVRFATPLAPAADGGAKDTVVEIAYECVQPLGGMTFSPATPAVAGEGQAQSAQVHTQGETETNRHWFAIHDFPNVRIATELVVDVPAGLQASANGALVSHEVRDGREVWHWNQEKPHAPYLVSLVVGDFDHAELPNPLSKVPMTVWAPKGRGADAKATYERTDRMMATFERVFGQKYPWARYDQLIVRNFGAGGMENTSVTTMQPTAVMDATARAEGDLDGLISHELCHQWTGDLITCRSWQHIWLNEGWATYGTALWMEDRDGPDGYWESVRGNANVARGDLPGAGEPMCSNVYKSAGETFRKPANPYPKGASILHMLRRMLGDKVFFAGVRNYFARFAVGNAETYDFRRAMEEASGLGLEWFFDQWCFRAGSPHVKASASYDPSTRTLTVKAEQTQQIDEKTPALRISMPVWVRTAKGERFIPFEMRDRTATCTATLDAAPEAVWLDPNIESLKALEWSQPEAWTIAALKGAPTLAAKLQAIEVLGQAETPDARQALLEVARDDRARASMRTAAVGAIAAWGSADSKAAILALARSPIADPRVRASVTSALSGCPKEDAVALAKAILVPANGGPGETSYAVRAAAIEVLNAHDAKDCLDIVRAQVTVPSHADAIANAALRFLAKHGDASDIERIEARAALGVMDRSRPGAIDALGTLAGRLEKDPKAKVVDFLVALMDDPEERTANAACGTLADLKAKPALKRLKAIAEHDRDPARRMRAEAWVKKVEANEDGSEPAPRPRGRRNG
jgi:aminopeptidase N